MRRFGHFVLILTHLFLVCCSGLSGQNTIGLPLITNFNKTEFMGGSQTWSIRQDSHGRMYFANNEGLITYDGTYWKIYPLPNRTIMRSLYIDKNDNIYVGGQDEMGYFSGDKNGTLTYTSLKDKIPASYRDFADIWDIDALKESIFFRASDRIFELRNNTMRVYRPTHEWTFLKTEDNILFAQDKDNGLLQFRDNKWYPVADHHFEKVTISGILSEGSGNFLITTRNSGFYYLHKDSISKSDIPLGDFDGYANVAVRINDSEFVAATGNQGCIAMNFKGGIVQKISRLEGLQNNNVTSVFADRDKNLWAGLNNGISLIAYNSPIKYIRPSRTNELAGYSTRIFDGRLYIGSSDGTYTAALGNTDKDISLYKSDFKQVRNSSGGETWRLEEVNQRLLMGHNNGTYQIRNEESFPVASGSGSWLFVPVSSVYPSENILVGTYTGLKMLGYTAGKFNDKGVIEGLPESFRFLAMDNEDNVWSSNPYRGVYRLSFSADKKKFTTKLFTEKDGLPSSLGNYVFRIKNRVVFATSKGVYEFDGQRGRFIPSAFLTPVFGDMELRYLTEDSTGNIWFCSGKKIGVVNFYPADGVKPFDITYIPELNGQILAGFENVYAYNRENVFIGSEKGVIHLNLRQYKAGHPAPDMQLNMVKAIGKTDSILFGGFRSPASEKIIRLSHLFNGFHFEYSSPVFGPQNNTEYSYQLLGYDQGWSVWSHKTEKDYTNLPGGDYSFQIKARDNLGNESRVTSFAFYLRPPWYNTVWARLSYAILTFLGLYLLYKGQLRKLHQQQVKFGEEQKKIKYIYQLELEKNEKEIVKLQNEKLAQEVLLKKKELANASMHLVENNDALMKIKEEVIRMHEKTDHGSEIKKLIALLRDTEKINANWDQFAGHFDAANDDFLKKLKIRFPGLSNTDLKMCAYLRLNLSSKEIAQLVNISVRGVEIRRYRIRKKMQLQTEQSVSEFLNQI